MSEPKEPERIRGVFAPNYPRKVLWKGKLENNRTADTIIIKQDEYSQSFIATIPELDGLSAFGNTPELALKELTIAKRLFLEVIEEVEHLSGADGIKKPIPKKGWLGKGE